MDLIRNILLLALLTLSSFGSLVCEETDGERCSCSALGRIIVSSVSDAEASELCPCDCGPEDCGEQVEGMECDLHQQVKVPNQTWVACPDAVELPLSTISLLEQSVRARHRLRTSVAPQILHGRDPVISSIVLRV